MSNSIWTKLHDVLGFGSNGDKVAYDDLHIVTAALMIQVSTTHEGFSDVEKAKTLQCIEEHFKLSEQEAYDVLTRAIEYNDEATDLYSFTRVIMKQLDQDGQQDIIRLLYRVAFADDDLDHFEEHIISRISGLLGVDVRDRVRIKQEVRAGG